MKKIYSLLLAGLGFSAHTHAQLVTGSVFLKGSFVEVGTFTNGAFGSGAMGIGATAPAGYHPMASCTGGNALGFVSDPDKDGWLVSAPGRSQYMGDYFVPGSPFEGWEIEVNGVKGRNWASGMFTSEVPTTTATFSATATEETGVWQGTFGGNLAITQRTVLKKSKLYFVIYVDLVNTGTTTLNNVYYHRGLDPDNEQPWTGCSHNTKNTIVFQPNAVSTKCMATAIGITYGTFAYLGLGTKDCRARCMNIPIPWHPAGLANLYNGTGTEARNSYNVGWTTPAAGGADEAIGLVWNLGSLAPGQKTSLAYTYILKQADLDSALNETEPKFESDGTPYAPYTTFRVCPGNTVPLKVINGGQYRWVWTPGTDMAASGASVKIPAGGTIPTLTGTTVYPDGAVFGDSCIVTVNGPKTYTAMGISNCDTQRLIFYVDTITFTTPPSVTTPVRYCEGDAGATPLTAGTAAGATLRWYTTASGGVPSLIAPTPSTAFAGLPGDMYDTVSYWVSQVNPAGCETPRAKIDVIITRKPAAPLVDSLVYCIGSTTSILTATGTGIKWYDAATAGTRFAGAPTPVNTPAGTTSYFASQTINGCESDRAELTVEISEAVAEFDLSEDSLCGPELVAMTNNSTSSVVADATLTHSWDFGDGSTDNNKHTTHSYADARGTYIVKLKVTNIHNCADEAQKTINVFPVPTISLSASDTMICQGGTIDFTGDATPGYNSLLWDFGDGDPAYNALQTRHAFNKPGIYNVTFSGTYPACDGVNASKEVNIIAIPNVNLGRDTTYCPGNAVLTLSNKNGTADHYIWSTGDTSASIQPRHQGEYWLRATNWQCSSADSITISKGCYLDIPNAFSPGTGGDYQDRFLPRELLSKSVTNFDMKIFDRWGQLIFESDKINGQGWDGNHKGQAMPFGVYVYLIKVSFANGVTESYQGNVTLVR